MSKNLVIVDNVIINQIYLVRGKKVMLDSDLAELYGVETKKFNQAVKRNIKRFPSDFMFKLTNLEFDNLRSQFVTSSSSKNKAEWGGRRYNPTVFTEEGVAMLSGVLNSNRAIKVNIQIMRIFTKMREMIITHKDILLKLEQLEKKITTHDQDIQMIFNALKQLLHTPNPPRKKIGYKRGNEE